MIGGEDQALPTGNVSFLITDIEGSTALYRRLGPRFEELLERHRDICRVAFDAYDGVEVACAGDGFAVAFKRAVDALAAAVDAQRALTAEAWPQGDEIRVRMGVHVGEARVTSTGGTYIGFGLHEAARVGDAGSGGQIVVSGAAHELLHGSLPAGIELVLLGAYRLRGLDDHHDLYEVRGDALLSGFGTLRTASAHTGNLGADVFEMVGRDDAITSVIQSVTARRLTTLVGPGGVGKTRLATAAARELLDQFRDGCWFVDLAGVPAGANDDEVAGVIGAAVAIEASHGVLGLTTAIAGRDLLLVMDNCEHVLDGATKAARAVLSAASGVRVLATSQAPLSLRDEHLVRVEPLALNDAAELFVTRAREVALEDPDVARICEQLDGLPLAIELAANQVRVLSPGEIAKRLGDRFSLLKGGASDVDTRHQTLRATIDWSYDLLDDAEQQLLRELSVFRGGAELPSIEAVCDHGLDVLTSLVDRSLVRVTRVSTGVRFGMLTSIHAYAHDRLVETGELNVLRTRHLDHFAARSWDSLQAMHRGTVTDELRRIGHEADNLRAAIAWALEGGDVEAGLRLACGAGFFGRESTGGYVYASRDWLGALLERGAAAGNADLRCQALLSSASVSVAEGDWARVLVDGEAALALVGSAQLGDELRAQALAMVGVAAEQAHPLREAAAFNRDFLKNTEPDAIAVPTREPADAVALLQEAAELARAEGLAGFRVVILTNVASAALQIGETATAREAAETALAEARDLGLGGGEARALNRLIYVALREGDFPGADSYAAEALIAGEVAGAIGELAATRAALASLSLLRGNHDAGRDHAHRARDLFASIGHWVPAARMWAAGATMYYALSLPDLAREAMDNLVGTLKLIGRHPAIPVILVTLIPQAEAAGHHDIVASLGPYVRPKPVSEPGRA